LAVAIAALASGCAAAADRVDWRQWKWAVDLDLDARWSSNVIEDREGAPSLHQGAGTIDLRGLAGKGVIAFAAAVDTEVGFEVPGDFMYGLHLQPLGFAFHVGNRTYLGLMGGVGFGGTVDRVPFAGEFPATAFLAFDLGPWVRVAAAARAIWIAGADERSGGSRTIDWADEAELRVGFAIGKRNEEWQAAWSDGTYVGAFAREQGGGRVIGIVIGLGMNGSSN
jgi:hypothetical protein